ncbi:hypothetical protein E2C01_000025 [Portunus trituberculatus]|uniref:Uncharacterized protein n=1 Tax=Portunus trituberculatus TaxID=210409 RepID=A0A5B7CII0_PORTR|nr:hypothetical protein [Portunus trituberculatus]
MRCSVGWRECWSLVSFSPHYNLISSLTLSSMASPLLYHMTIRQDVTPNHVQVLMKLQLKPGFNIPASFVLRLYNLLQPDLVIGQLVDRTVVKRLPPALKTRLLEARMRLQGEVEYLDTGGQEQVMA